MGEKFKVTAKAPEVKSENRASGVQKTCSFQYNDSPVDPVLYLQRTVGNRAVQKLIKSGALRTKLKIGLPGDIYEQEADRVAEQVIGMPEPQVSKGTVVSDKAGNTIQRSCPGCTRADNQLVKENEEELVQAKEYPGDTPEIAPDIESRINSMKGGGQSLPESVREFYESRFGYDFSQVRVHTDAQAAEAASAVNALAYTMGTDVVFGAGQYAPETMAGKRLLAHELTHVAQQSRSEGNSLNQSNEKRGLCPIVHPIAQLSTVALVQRQPKSSKCSDAEVTILNTEMHVYCNKPRSCSMQGDSCATATAKVAAGNGCVDGRTKLQQKCFSPGDPGYQNHMKRIAEDSAALRNCIEVMTAKCALEAAAAAALAAAALALKKGAKKAMTGVAGRALVYAEVAAAVILLASGKAEAKISLEGDSPLEALFKAMEQDGVPVPDEMKKMIEGDPELKEMLEESAKKGGNLSDVQKEIAKKYAEYISQHMDEFSKEELHTIMATTDQIADKMPDTVKVEDIKKALKEKADKKSGPEQEGKGTKEHNTPKQPAGTTPQTGTPSTPSDTQALKYKDLNDENKKKIKDAPQSVSRLFQEFVSGQKEDVKLDDIAVKKFFEIVPADLTDKQAEALISRLASSQGKTIDDILESLKKGVEEVRKDATLTNDGTATATNTTANEQNQPAKSQEQIIAELKEMAKKSNFSKVPEGSYRIKNISEKIVDNKITAYVYGKIKGVGVVGYITGTVPAIDIKKLKIGDSFVMTITSQSPFVDKDGKVYKLKMSGSLTITK